MNLTKIIAIHEAKSADFLFIYKYKFYGYRNADFMVEKVYTWFTIINT